MHYFSHRIFLLVMLGTATDTLIGSDIHTDKLIELFCCASQTSTEVLTMIHTYKQNYNKEKFRKACEKNDSNTIKSMLEIKQISFSDPEIGSLFLHSFENISHQCLRDIAFHSPYALWDSLKPVWDSRHRILQDCLQHGKNVHYYIPNFCLKYGPLRDSLALGFMIPYKLTVKGTWHRKELPTLHYFLQYRLGIQFEDYEPAEYDLIEKLLQDGANIHHIDSDGENAFYYIENLANHTEKEKLKNLLQQYDHRPIKELVLCAQTCPSDVLNEICIATYPKTVHMINSFNTTDMFYPGTKFYRAPEKT